MPTQPGEDDKFEYDGRLVFNGIYLQFADKIPFDSKEMLLEEVPEFEEGEPGAAGSGFSDLQLDDWQEQYGELPTELETIIGEVWDLEFTKEAYDPADDIVDSDGHPITGYIQDDWSAYVYWYPGEFLLIQASQSKLNDLEEQLFPVIGRTPFNSDSGNGGSDGGSSDDTFDLSPNSGFDPEFLKWLVWKYDTSGGPSRLDINTLSDAAMSGNLSNFGRTNEVSDSRDITSSHPIIAGILENRDFDELEGVFEVSGHEVDAQIYQDGRIRVMAQEDVGEATQYRRILLANLFLRQLLREYNDWRSRSPDSKYVHPQYFEELHDHAQNMSDSATYNFEFDTLVKKYANLREEDPSTYSINFNI